MNRLTQTPKLLGSVLKTFSPEPDRRPRLRHFFYQEVGRTWCSPKEKHPYTELFLVFSGEGLVAVNGIHVFLQKGSVLLVGPGVEIQGKLGRQKLKIASFCFDLPRVEEKRAVKPGSWDHWIKGGIEEIQELCLKIAAKPEAARQHGVVLEWILLLLSEDSKIKKFNRQLYPVFKHIEYYKGKERCSVRELCRIAGTSPRQLSRLFRDATGHSPVAWCIRFRIELAKRLLLDKGARIQEVAGELGYSDAFLFIRQFKNFTGRTPKAWQLAE